MYAIPRSTLHLLVSAACFVAGCADRNLEGDAELDGSGGSATGPVGSGGAGGAGQTTSTGGAGSFEARLGAMCTSDGDCDPGGSCLLPTDRDPFLGGGPAHGYCTAPCTMDIDCPGDHGVCLDDDADGGGEGRCFLGCTLGEPPYTAEIDPLPADKCHGRDDLRCQVVGEAPVCLPTCGDDADCPSDRRCDQRLAVCVSEASTGEALGSACDVEDDACAGRCVIFLSGVTMCSSLCVLGGGVEPDTTECGGLADGYCAFRPEDNGMGDYGFCTESCAEHDDCQNPAFWCFPVPDVNTSGDRGYCFAATDCRVPSDCASGEECVTTAFGDKCISTAFELGEGSRPPI